MNELLERLRALVGQWERQTILKVSLGVVVVLAVFQVLRFGGVVFAEYRLSRSLEEVSTGGVSRDSGKTFEDFEGIFAKGAFGRGKVPTPPVKLFGVLGNQALIGSSPGDVKPFDLGAELPDGRKIVRIGSNEVSLKKDEEESSLQVFPEFGGKPERGGRRK